MKYFVILASVLFISGLSGPAFAQAQSNRQAQAKRLKNEMTAVNMAFQTDNKCALLTPLGRIAAKAKALELRQIAVRAGFGEVDKFEASIATFVDEQTCAGLGKNGFVKAGKERVERLVALQVASWRYYFKDFGADHLGNEICNGNYYWDYEHLEKAMQKYVALEQEVRGMPDAQKKHFAQQVKGICEAEKGALDNQPVMLNVMTAMLDSVYTPNQGVKFGKKITTWRKGKPVGANDLVHVPWAVEGTTSVDILGNGSPITDGSMLGQGSTIKTVHFGFAQNKQFFMIIDSGLSNTTLGAQILDAHISTNISEHAWVLRTSTKEFNAADAPARFGDVVYAMNIDQSAALMKAILAGEQLNLAYTRKLFGTETIKVQNLDGENLKKAVLYTFAPKISF